MKDKSWEKEFDEEFEDAFCCNGDYCTGNHEEEANKDVKSFISSLLKAQKSDLKKKVGGMKYDTEGTLLDVDQERF